MSKYRFSKGYDDIVTPVVIEGNEIKNGATVEIINKSTLKTSNSRDTWIDVEDENGNVQRTYRTSLIFLNKA